MKPLWMGTWLAILNVFYLPLAEAGEPPRADCEIDGTPAGENLAAKFKPSSSGAWELQRAKPLTRTESETLTVSVKDRQGNLNRIDRTFTSK